MYYHTIMYMQCSFSNKQQATVLHVCQSSTFTMTFLILYTTKPAMNPVLTTGRLSSTAAAVENRSSSVASIHREHSLPDSHKDTALSLSSFSHYQHTGHIIQVVRRCQLTLNNTVISGGSFTNKLAQARGHTISQGIAEHVIIMSNIWTYPILRNPSFTYLTYTFLYSSIVQILFQTVTPRIRKTKATD